ncbi:hypothetical protein SBOR_9443 [Sclerotinia borealis F-4128]|uniref:Uncharacterized protein n=1 Tax=Sclerotinia borealis (strain F-4128) TaxID=1432307 RepID=W9C5I1_SCLBF|nr:hypothetical protein SBOR_9443 [Sclerotinia borealis F-4128]
MGESDDSKVNELQLFNPRKRLRLEQLLPQKLSQLPLKKQKSKHLPRGSQPPAEFWDNLSKIWLTEDALEDQPVTRSVVAKWKNKWEHTQPATDSLARYSAEDIQLVARHGGLDLSDIIGYRNPLYCIMSSKQSISRGRKRKLTTPLNTKSTTHTTTTENTGPYDRNFQQALIDGGVYSNNYRHPDGMIPIIEGNIEKAEYSSGGIPFTNLDDLTAAALVSFGNPDRYYGSRPERLSLQVRTKLSNHIIPSTQLDLPVAPNFVLAVKGPNRSFSVAQRHANYDGALCARGMNSLQSYGQDETAYDNNASTITSIYYGGCLNMYTSHSAQPNGPGSRPEYYMTQINAWAMTGNVKAFRDGARAFRNARDWAKEQRDEAIRQANTRANDIKVSTFVATASPGVTPESQSQQSLSTQIVASNTSKPPHQDSDKSSEDSDTSSDELARDMTPPAKRSKS